MLTATYFRDAATEAALVDPSAPVVSSTTSDRARAFLEANARGGTYQPDPRLIAPKTTAPTSSLTPPSTEKPWYKKPAVVVPVAVGGVAALGLLVWIFK